MATFSQHAQPKIRRPKHGFVAKGQASPKRRFPYDGSREAYNAQYSTTFSQGTPKPKKIKPKKAKKAKKVAPFDPTYEATVGGLTKSRNDTLADIVTTGNQAAARYGYTLTRDPKTGAVIGYQVDPNNPFSKLALLKQSYGNARRGNTTNYAAAGQLYAGSLKNAQNGAQHTYEQNYNTTTTNFGNIIAGLTQRRRNAIDTFTTGVQAAAAAVPARSETKAAGTASNTVALGAVGHAKKKQPKLTTKQKRYVRKVTGKKRVSFKRAKKILKKRKAK